MATCPECDAEIEVDDDDLEEMEVGDPWDCAACGSRLRVVDLDPLEFESDDDDEDDEESGDDKEGGAGDDDEEDADEDDEDDDESGGGDWDE
jgi:lysine biosynthesis protein LysW